MSRILFCIVLYKILSSVLEININVLSVKIFFFLLLMREQLQIQQRISCSCFCSFDKVQTNHRCYNDRITVVLQKMQQI